MTQDEMRDRRNEALFRSHVNRLKFGQAIKARRKALGMSQSELAERVGYANKATIGKIEGALNDLPLTKLWDFAEALETDPYLLLGLAPPIQYDREVTELTKYEINMIKRLRAMNDEQREFLEKISIREYTIAMMGNRFKNEDLMKVVSNGAVQK